MTIHGLRQAVNFCVFLARVESCSGICVSEAAEGCGFTLTYASSRIGQLEAKGLLRKTKKVRDQGFGTRAVLGLTRKGRQILYSATTDVSRDQFIHGEIVPDDPCWDTPEGECVAGRFKREFERLTEHAIASRERPYYWSAES